MRDQADTRTRIQRVALELFNEKGYEATSLREIAEELGVTKAALYYHFRSKDDIVASLAEGRLGDIQRILDWARGQPQTVETRREIVRRYCDDLYSAHRTAIMRFFERNQTALRDHPTVGKNRELMMDLVALLHAPDASPVTRVKSSLGLFAVHAAAFLPMSEGITDEERKEAALEVAFELVSSE
ncbi:TetR/AcrR family transcriptional regulator [Streptosporangium sp. KLBMP 9127]|nr:TetR/AcrR family transcriptional regulator [Streptosporangium sp. KLBMP 9127]